MLLKTGSDYNIQGSKTGHRKMGKEGRKEGRNKGWKEGRRRRERREWGGGREEKTYKSQGKRNPNMHLGSTKNAALLKACFGY